MGSFATLRMTAVEIYCGIAFGPSNGKNGRCPGPTIINEPILGGGDEKQ